MKSLNIKKIAAVGAGLALVAASVVAAPVKWSDLVDNTAKQSKFAGVVVGAVADVSDTTAAQSLAAVFASKAVSVESSTEVQTVQECTPNSEFNGDVKKFDTSALGSAISSQAVTYTSLDNLIYESALNYKVGGSTYEASAKEQLTFTVTPTFDVSTDTQRLNAEIGSGELLYTLDLGVGIDFNSDSGWTSGTTWTDTGASDKVEIPFLGKDYVVHKVTLSGSNIQQLELFEKNAIQTYTVGQKIDNLEGKDGKSYYILVNAVTTGSEAVMSLYDASTNVVVEDYENEKIGESEKFAEDILETVVEVTDIDNWGTTDVPDWHIEAAVGAEAVTIYEGKGYPYDSTKTSTSDYDWQVSSITQSGTTTLLTVVLNNTSKYKFKNDDGLAPGETANFPGGLAQLEFVGLQLPEFDATNVKEVTETLIGAEVSEGSGRGIIYTDSSETVHELPFYYEFDLDDADSSDAELSYTYQQKVDNFEFDGKTFSLKVDWESDENIVVYLYEGSYASSATTELDNLVIDLNVNAGAASHNYDVVGPLYLPNSEDTNVEYDVGVDTSEEKVWLLLSAQTIDAKDADVIVVGTDINGESSTWGDPTAMDAATFFAPADNGDFETMIANTIDYNALLDGDHDEFDDAYASLFYTKVGFNTASSPTQYVYTVIDAETEVAIAYGASSNASNAIPGPAYQAYDDYAITLKVRKGATNGLELLYDTYGVKTTIDDDDVLTIVIPEEQAKTEFRVTGVGGEGAETCVDVNKEVVVENNVPYIGLPSVLTDAEAVDATAKYIVVGGYLVNQLAVGTEAQVTAEGQSMTDFVNGNLVVYGWTKEDTAKAVADLVAVLENASLIE